MKVSVEAVNTILALKRTARYMLCMSKPKPPETMKRKSVTIPQSMWEEVAAYRRIEQIGSEMETLRRLIQAGLRAETRKVKR
jgi:hypothetical protein